MEKEQNGSFDLESTLNYPELPIRVLHTYGLLWQLEIWLRRMIYIEFRAALGDNWHTKFNTSAAQRSFEADKRLSHMSTPEMEIFSYMTFGELCNTISREWRFFECYFPPKDLWDAKLEEIKQIRHRIAHFRFGHEDDLQRVRQFLRDIDKGFWAFCTSYNDPYPIVPPSSDPVVLHFLKYDQFPWTEINENKWARIGIADPNALFNLTIEGLKRPWVTDSSPSDEGYLYDIRIVARNSRVFEYDQYLQDTTSLHSHLGHICLDSLETSLKITIPYVLGSSTIIDIIATLIRWIPNAIRGPRANSVDDEQTNNLQKKVHEISTRWPEYILSPDNPLTFLSPDMSCPFFRI